MPLDIGVGILLSLGVAKWFGVGATPLFVAFGIGSTLLPDLDIFPPLWRTNYDHRSLIHYPIWYMPLSVLVYVGFGPLLATLFFLSILAHFIHDTIGLGWGVAWLWPISKRKFLFPETGRRREHGFFMTWLPEEELALAEKYHNPNWVRDYYLTPNTVAYVEYGTLLLAIIILVFTFGT